MPFLSRLWQALGGLGLDSGPRLGLGLGAAAGLCVLLFVVGRIGPGGRDNGTLAYAPTACRQAIAAGSCVGGQGESGVWMCAQTNAQSGCQSDEFFISGTQNSNLPAGTTGGIKFDFLPPVTEPENIRASAGDSAVVVSWDVQPGDINGFRVLCEEVETGNPPPNKGMAAPALDKIPNGTIYYTKGNLCPNGPFSTFKAGSNTPIDDSGTTTDDSVGTTDATATDATTAGTTQGVDTTGSTGSTTDASSSTGDSSTGEPLTLCQRLGEPAGIGLLVTDFLGKVLNDDRADWREAWAFFPGGILGRVDDMIHIRGNNFYPSAIDDVIRRFPAVGEYRIVLDKRGPLADLTVEVELHGGTEPQTLEPIERALRNVLLFRAEVAAVPVGSLPRSEMKSRRVCVRTP